LEKEKDTDKDKGSLSTTVTGTRTHTRSSHRKGNKLPNKGSHTLALGSEKHLDNKKGQGQKPSFISRLVRVLIPCVGPSSRAHDQDLDKAASGVAVVEKAARVNGEPPAVNGRATSTSAVAEQTIGEPSTSSTIISSIVSQNLVAPPQAPVVDPDVVIPPTPTKLLPQEETEGLMSGAVQPPGSKGEEHVHNRTHSQDSADESDATSTFTEDEDIDDINALDELEDEEDRLIMNGGIGIPIGPVRPRLSFLRPFISIYYQDGVPRPLLPPLAPQHAGRKCLVLDLDETLLHSSFKVK
jgi:RNA polymerase II subunit A small phosphatase-like protein